MTKICVFFFNFIHFLVLFVKKIGRFWPQVWTNKVKDYTDCSRKLGKLEIQIKDDYYINSKNAQIGKM